MSDLTPCLCPECDGEFFRAFMQQEPQVVVVVCVDCGETVLAQYGEE